MAWEIQCLIRLIRLLISGGHLVFSTEVSVLVWTKDIGLAIFAHATNYNSYFVRGKLEHCGKVVQISFLPPVAACILNAWSWTTIKTLMPIFDSSRIVSPVCDAPLDGFKTVKLLYICLYNEFEKNIFLREVECMTWFRRGGWFRDMRRSHLKVSCLRGGNCLAEMIRRVHEPQNTYRRSWKTVLATAFVWVLEPGVTLKSYFVGRRPVTMTWFCRILVRQIIDTF